jgi:hypothetical protein
MKKKRRELVALSIEEISRRSGIKGTSGSFDFAKEDAKQTRLLEDNRQFVAGNDRAAPPVTPGLDAERNIRRAVEAGLAPAKPSTLNDNIFASEASPSDVRNNTMSAYFEKSSNTYNIGPGLNLDSPLVIKAMQKRGFDPKAFKETYDFDSKQNINADQVAGMREVFNDVVEGAKKDARTFVGASTWNKLKSHEKDAITDMSYNLGLKNLGGFKNMREAIIALANNRSPEAITAVTEQMVESKWYSQVGNRAIKVINTFSNGDDSDTKRWLDFSA